MAEYEESIVINAPVDEVFNFVSNLNNLPQFLPTPRHAHHAGEDRLRVRSAGEEQGYDTAGYFRVAPSEYFMEWSAETERNYSGWLEVEDFDDGCEVTVHLSFHPSRDINEGAPEWAEGIDAALQDALVSIKRSCESASLVSSEVE